LRGLCLTIFSRAGDNALSLAGEWRFQDLPSGQGFRYCLVVRRQLSRPTASLDLSVIHAITRRKSTHALAPPVEHGVVSERQRKKQESLVVTGLPE